MTAFHASHGFGLPFPSHALLLALQDLEKRLLFLCTVSPVLVTAREIRDQVALPVESVLGVRARDIGVEQALGDHGELGEDGAVPSAEVLVDG